MRTRAREVELGSHGLPGDIGMCVLHWSSSPQHVPRCRCQPLLPCGSLVFLCAKTSKTKNQIKNGERDCGARNVHLHGHKGTQRGVPFNRAAYTSLEVLPPQPKPNEASQPVQPSGTAATNKTPFFIFCPAAPALQPCTPSITTAARTPLWPSAAPWPRNTSARYVRPSNLKSRLPPCSPPLS